MGGPGSGTLRHINPMSAWYREHKCTPNAIVRYQYGIKDRLIMERTNLKLEDVANIERALPRLDMLVIEPDRICIVEMKPNAQLRDIGQALQYKESLMRDVMLAPYLDRPVHVCMCTLVENANVRALCEGQGIEYCVIPTLELPAST